MFPALRHAPLLHRALAPARRLVAGLERPRARGALRRLAGAGAARARPPLPHQRRKRGPAARPRSARGVRGVGPGGPAGRDPPRGLRPPRGRAPHPRRGAAPRPRRAPRQWLLIGQPGSRRRWCGCRSSSWAACWARSRTRRRTGGRWLGSGSSPRCSPRSRCRPARRFAEAWLEGGVFFLVLLRWLDHTFRHYSAIPWPLTWLPIALLAAYCALYVGLAGAWVAWARPRLGPGWALATVRAALGGRGVAARLAHGRIPVGARGLFAARRAAGDTDRRAHRRVRRLVPARRGELRDRRPPPPRRAARPARRRRRGGPAPRRAGLRLERARRHARAGHPGADRGDTAEHRADAQVGPRAARRDHGHLRGPDARGGASGRGGRSDLEARRGALAGDGDDHFPPRGPRAPRSSDASVRRAPDAAPGGVHRPAGNAPSAVPEQRIFPDRTRD